MRTPAVITVDFETMPIRPRPEYPPKPVGVSVRFWAKVDIRGPDECWPWLASTKGQRCSVYGQFWFKGSNEGAHRVAFMLTKGRIPKGLFVCHTCDENLCCNPRHLWLGTHLQNMADMVRKGRSQDNSSPLRRRRAA